MASVSEIFSRKRIARMQRRLREADEADNGSTDLRRLLTRLGLVAIVLSAAIAFYIRVLGGGLGHLENVFMGVLVFVVLGVCGQQLLRIVAPSTSSRQTYWSLLVVALLVSMGEVVFCRVLFARLSAAILPSASQTGLVAYPNVAMAFLVAMLYGGPAALVIGAITSTVIAVVADASFGLSGYLAALCATCVIASVAPRIGHRDEMAGIGLQAGAIQLFFLLIALSRQKGIGLEQMCLQAGVFYATLAFSVLVCALLLLPAAEKLTKRTSNVTVGYYANLEQPLLRRLCLEAPGTYHHAMMVGDLAQAAAVAIGANGVLARVGAYYHDIGKLTHPHFYMENQSGVGNPHDDLPPNISRIVIMNHVKEGLVLAKLEHLPLVLRRFIATHHGTGVARWFLLKEQKRLEARGGAAERNDDPTNDYRYPGPLPTTREETIVSLADSVEAASRSMRFFDRAKIEGLVNGIIQDRWTDGQLAESMLTNAELEQVRKSFVSTLVHLLHGRLPYPTQK